jgi:DNA-binding transcriptional regulator GbsR (MarR family)
MTPTPQDEFVDAIGLHFETMGAPKMMGRILAHLMVCDPPVQSSGQLIDALQTTSGTISTNTRLLMLHGIIEKVQVTGSRASHFRLVDGALIQMLQVMLKDVAGIKVATDRFVAATGEDVPRVVAEFSAFADFLQSRMGSLLAEWHEHRATLFDD